MKSNSQLCITYNVFFFFFLGKETTVTDFVADAQWSKGASKHESKMRPRSKIITLMKKKEKKIEKQLRKKVEKKNWKKIEININRKETKKSPNRKKK